MPINNSTLVEQLKDRAQKLADSEQERKLKSTFTADVIWLMRAAATRIPIINAEVIERCMKTLYEDGCERAAEEGDNPEVVPLSWEELKACPQTQDELREMNHIVNVILLAALSPEQPKPEGPKLTLVQ